MLEALQKRKKRGGATVISPAMTVTQQAQCKNKRHKALAKTKNQSVTTLPSPPFTAEQQARSKANRVSVLE